LRRTAAASTLGRSGFREAERKCKDCESDDAVFHVPA
jgi:hypothetical protein